MSGLPASHLELSVKDRFGLFQGACGDSHPPKGEVIEIPEVWTSKYIG